MNGLPAGTAIGLRGGSGAGTGRKRHAVVALAAAGIFHVAAIARAGADSGECIVALQAWLLIVLGMKGAGSRGMLSRCAGYLILLAALAQCARMADGDLWFLKLFPFLLAGGVVLASGGGRQLRCGWRAWSALAVAVIPNSALAPLLDPGGLVTAIHAPIAAFILHYLGFEVRLNGPTICLAAGSATVGQACSGFGLMALLFKVVLIVSVMVPIGWRARFMAGIGALGVGFAIGVIRVAILAGLVGSPAWFQWLHGPAGSNLFPVLAFVGLAPFLAPAEEPIAILVKRFRVDWEASSGCAVRSPDALAVLTLVFCCGVACLVPHRPDSLPCPFGELAWYGVPAPPRQATVPSELASECLDRIDGAWLWTADNAGLRWKLLICSVSSAQQGPFEMLHSRRFCDFLRVQTGAPLPSAWPASLEKAGAHARLGTVGLDGGELGFFGLNANGLGFVDTPGYLSARTATLKSPRTWVQWLFTGRRLEDHRYWLGVIVASTCQR